MQLKHCDIVAHGFVDFDASKIAKDRTATGLDDATSALKVGTVSVPSGPPPGGQRAQRGRQRPTPNLPTKIIAAKIPRFELSWKFHMGLEFHALRLRFRLSQTF